MLRPITNVDNLIRTTEVVSRIATIEGIMECPHTGAEVKEEYSKELEALRGLLASVHEHVAPTTYSPLLIRASFFVEYAKHLAEDCGFIDFSNQWPYSHINWQEAAIDLAKEYAVVVFDSVSYRMRYE